MDIAEHDAVVAKDPVKAEDCGGVRRCPGATARRDGRARGGEAKRDDLVGGEDGGRCRIAVRCD